MNQTPEEILEARSEFSDFEDSNDFYDCLDSYISSQRILQEYIEDSAAVEAWKIRAKNLQKSHSRVFIKKLLDFGEITQDEQFEVLFLHTEAPEAFINAVREDTELQSILDCFLSRIKKGITWEKYVKALDALAQKRRAETIV